MSYRTDQTALVVPIAAAEAVVGEVRRAHDPAAAHGVPAHVTILFPWLPPDQVDDDVVSDLKVICAGVAAFDVALSEVGRFDAAVAWLAPEPEQPFRDLTERIAAHWPSHPPYGGAFDDVVPHLTIAESDLDAAEAGVVPGLPVRQHVDHVALLVFDGARWEQRATFPLG